MSERASERDAIVRYLRATAYDDGADAFDPTLTSAAERIAEEAHSEFRRERIGNFELIDGLVLADLTDERDAARAQLAAAEARIARLTAVLAPLLEHPLRGCCVFCSYCPLLYGEGEHDADCPTQPDVRAALMDPPQASP